MFWEWKFSCSKLAFDWMLMIIHACLDSHWIWWNHNNTKLVFFKLDSISGVDLFPWIWFVFVLCWIFVFSLEFCVLKASVFVFKNLIFVYWKEVYAILKRILRIQDLSFLFDSIWTYFPFTKCWAFFLQLIRIWSVVHLCHGLN